MVVVVVVVCVCVCGGGGVGWGEAMDGDKEVNLLGYPDYKNVCSYSLIAKFANNYKIA